MNRIKSPWYRTGQTRIVPWLFGLMRAEFCERRDLMEPIDHEVMEYQTRWVSTGRLPYVFDNNGPYGFYSTLSTPPGDKRYGDRALWRRFISYWQEPTEPEGD